MAYMSQERKKELAPKILEICKRYNIKATLSVMNRASLQLNIRSGKIDFINNLNDNNKDTPDFNLRKDYINVDKYSYGDNFSGEALDFLNEVIPAMNKGNHDNSDSQSDYFDVGWYIDVNIGKYYEPYVLIK